MSQEGAAPVHLRRCVPLICDKMSCRRQPGLHLLADRLRIRSPMRKGHRFAPIRYLRTSAVYGFIVIAGWWLTMKDPPPGPAPRDAGAQAMRAPLLHGHGGAITTTTLPLAISEGLAPIRRSAGVVASFDQ